jgi:hypothetical protein
MFTKHDAVKPALKDFHEIPFRFVIIDEKFSVLRALAPVWSIRALADAIQVRSAGRR